jgi:hypothetical protein
LGTLKITAGKELQLGASFTVNKQKEQEIPQYFCYAVHKVFHIIVSKASSPFEGTSYTAKYITTANIFEVTQILYIG